MGEGGCHFSYTSTPLCFQGGDCTLTSTALLNQSVYFSLLTWVINEVNQAGEFCSWHPNRYLKRWNNGKTKQRDGTQPFVTIKVFCSSARSATCTVLVPSIWILWCQYRHSHINIYIFFPKRGGNLGITLLIMCMVICFFLGGGGKAWENISVFKPLSIIGYCVGRRLFVNIYYLPSLSFLYPLFLQL